VPLEKCTFDGYSTSDIRLQGSTGSRPHWNGTWGKRPSETSTDYNSGRSLVARRGVLRDLGGGMQSGRRSFVLVSIPRALGRAQANRER